MVVQTRSYARSAEERNSCKPVSRITVAVYHYPELSEWDSDLHPPTQYLFHCLYDVTRLKSPDRPRRLRLHSAITESRLCLSPTERRGLCIALRGALANDTGLEVMMFDTGLVAGADLAEEPIVTVSANGRSG